MLIGEDRNEEGGEDFDTMVNEMEKVLTIAKMLGEISLNALSGHSTASTIRLQEKFKGRKWNILIDTVSTHSFVDKGLLSKWGL